MAKKKEVVEYKSLKKELKTELNSGLKKEIVLIDQHQNLLYSIMNGKGLDTAIDIFGKKKVHKINQDRYRKVITLVGKK